MWNPLSILIQVCVTCTLQITCLAQGQRNVYDMHSVDELIVAYA